MSLARRIATRSYRQFGAARIPAARRTYASASDAAHKASETAKKGLQSDLPWLVTAVAVTVPGTYWILSTGKVEKEHGHPGEAHHGSHDHDDEPHEEAPEDEQPADDEDASERPKDSENRTESNQPPTGETQDGGIAKKGMAGSQPEGEKAKSQNEGKNVPGEPGDDEQISEKSLGSGEFGEEQELENNKEGKEGSDKRIHKPDAKGGAKRRIESGAGKDLGKEEDIEGEDQSATEKAAPSKEPVPGATSSKQAGLSNTNTKHSTDIGNDPEKSKKPDGSPETAKMQGTVDPTRPAK